MRRLVYFFVAMTFSLHVSAQEPEGFGVFYGVDLSQVYTGSGHGSSFAMNTNIQKGRRSLELGMLYQQDQSRVSGGDVEYKVFLGKNAFLDNQASSQGVTLKPYVHYNCIYHNSKVNTPDYFPVGSKKSTYPELPSSPGTIATMEHYAGMGLQMMISGNICIDGSLGFGAYIGSLDKINTPETLGIHKENYGFVMSFEFGLGYKFGI
ncbi:MAG TPA: hypothetical protein VE870_15235 [Bacteroidales bacterium]|nr:hypothetical protein [Bacteroidales bacterium]